jgi:hypothetical protein
MHLFRYGLLMIMLSCAWDSFAQIVISGIVSDSLTLSSLPDTNIKSKRTGKVIQSNAQGFFSVALLTYDTLLFTRTGYKTLEYPVFFSEDDILILLSEDVKMLEEVVINGYQQPAIKHPDKPREIHTLETLEMFQSPFTYFSKTEREKRKIFRYRSGQARIQVYADVVADPQLRQDIMQRFSITEEQYNNILVNFNMTHKQVQYLTSETDIIDQIVAYFDLMLRNHPPPKSN